MSTIKSIIDQALLEDAPNGDITVDSIIPEKSHCEATIIAKETGIFFGKKLIETAFRIHDEHADIHCFKNDSDPLNPGDIVATIKSSHNNILLVERSLLNLIQRLSGVATQTQRYVQALNNPKIKILDTRKTSVGLRSLEKQAIVAGGGHNHRMGLSDMILIKENHLSILKQQGQSHTLEHRLKKIKATKPELKIEIEIETQDELETYPLHLVDYILLDNFSFKDLEKAIAFCKENYPDAEIECSGNVHLENIAKYSRYAIHRISVGALTHSVKAFDFSLLISSPKSTSTGDSIKLK